MAGLAKGCPKLKVLSLANLVGTQGQGGGGSAGGLTDKSLKALGKRCKQLSSLNCARSGAGFTDSGIKALQLSAHRIHEAACFDDCGQQSQKREKCVILDSIGQQVTGTRRMVVLFSLVVC